MLDREEKIIQFLQKAASMKKEPKVIPPTAPLPYHLLPKKLIASLGIDPPLQIIKNVDSKKNKKKAL